jgi:NAD(P)H-hydrate epimerase
MKSPGFSLDTLMELAGYSVACAVHDFYLTNLHNNDDIKNVLVICGPGNNGICHRNAYI